MSVDDQRCARYAIYYAPPQGSALGRFGAAWLGWDAEDGVVRQRPTIDGLPTSIEALSARASRYGFHATLKAPFRLSEDETAAALIDALKAYAATRKPVVSPKLAVKDDLGFVSLRPSGDAPELNAFAAEIVQRFDGFRAPITPEELERRRAAPLTPAQDANLTTWGYPYVLDAFRFHMTLSNSRDSETLGRIVSALEPHIAPLLDDPFTIGEVCLFGEPAPQPGGDTTETARHFRLLRRFQLRG